MIRAVILLTKHPQKDFLKEFIGKPPLFNMEPPVRPDHFWGHLCYRHPISQTHVQFKPPFILVSEPGRSP